MIEVDNPGALPAHEVNRLVKSLRARVAELEAERDAITRLMIGRNRVGLGWTARIVSGPDIPSYYHTEAEAVAAVRRAAGLDGGATP